MKKLEEAEMEQDNFIDNFIRDCDGKFSPVASKAKKISNGSKLFDSEPDYMLADKEIVDFLESLSTERMNEQLFS